MAGIQFILGRSGTGKTRWCIDHICQALLKNDRRPLVLLVPEQATYQAERAILSRPGIPGFSRLRVISFERLCYLLEGPVRSGTELTAAAKQMIVHKILLEQAGRLTLYKGDLQRTGLAGKLAALLGDLQADNCTARQVQTLAESLASTPGQELTSAKWSDIAQVFAAYEQFFETGKFVNSGIQLSKASANVAGAAFLKGAQLWVDGFSGFSGQERQLLVEMLKVCDKAHLAFCLDAAAFDPDNDDPDTLVPDSLFASAEQTCCQLTGIIRKLKLPLDKPVLLTGTLRFAKAPALAALEAGPAGGIETDCGPAAEHIQIAACSTVRAEACYIAESISELVRRHNLRYRDIAVVLPEMETYPHYIESAFREFGIPYFLDRPRRMKTHPLSELVGSALQAVLGGFTLADVLSFLKSGLGPLDADSVDMLETYARAFDVQHAEWTQTSEWNFAPATEKEQYAETALNALRQTAMAPLKKLRRTLTAAPQMTAGQFVAAVWELLEDLEAARKLAEWAAEDITDQRCGHRQVFEKTVELLDQMHAVFGVAPMAAHQWASILTDAFGSLTIKLIPPKLDQVLVGSIERSRHPDVQAIFLAGAAQKHFPVPLAGEGLLTDMDYAAAEPFEVSRPAYLDLTHRPYLAYIALTRASKRIVLTYPLLDEKQAPVVPWSGIDLLRRCFVGLDIVMPQPTQAADRLYTPGLLSHWLCARLGRDRQEDEQTDMTAGVLECLRHSDQPQLQTLAAQADKALAYDNAARLQADAAAGVFAFPLHLSASKLGTFAACPYQYFAKYALRLERRQLAGFEPLDIGSFYHNVLEQMFLTMRSQGRNWGDRDAAQLDALCRSTAEYIMENDALIVNFTRRKAHHRCILDAAVETVRAFVPALAELGRAGAFTQEAAELVFGPKASGTGFMTLADGRQVHLSGRIDRLDIARINGQTLAVVFDYKSGIKAAAYAKMLYGLDLQLPIYLLAIETTDFTDDTDFNKKLKITKNKKVIPVGAFYLPIDAGFRAGSLSEMDQAQAAFGKAKGLFDGRFAQVLDAKVQPQQQSAFFNFYINKEDAPYSYYKTSGALKPEDFTTLLAFAKRRIRELAETMAAGCVDIRPYRLGMQSPCSYCDYRAVCRFDWQINDYNILDPCDKETAIERMKGEVK